MTNAYYVYTHDKLVEDKWVPFYVGKGKGGRAKDMRRSNRWHANVCAKYETRFTIWQDALSELSAFEHEIDLIDFLKSEEIVLVNATNGGEGPSGYAHTEDSKRRIGEKSKLWIRPDTLKAKISESQRGDRNSAKAPGVGLKISIQLTGRVWITDGIKDKQVRPENPIPSGWRYGRTSGKKVDLSKFIGCTKGMVWVTNGVENKRLRTMETMPEGWKKGRVTPWQKR